MSYKKIFVRLHIIVPVCAYDTGTFHKLKYDDDTAKILPKAKGATYLAMYFSDNADLGMFIFFIKGTEYNDVPNKLDIAIVNGNGKRSSITLFNILPVELTVYQNIHKENMLNPNLQSCDFIVHKGTQSLLRKR